MSFSGLNSSSSFIEKLSILFNNDANIFGEFIFSNKNKILLAFNLSLFFVKKSVTQFITSCDISLYVVAK